jgi:hypothetical protein
MWSRVFDAARAAGFTALLPGFPLFVRTILLREIHQ